MATEIHTEIKLTEIRDLHWPVDRDKVESMRQTLQRGMGLGVIKVNKLGHGDRTAYYEIIDGFHRFAAAQAEKKESLTCEVYKLTERDARYERIVACKDQPAEVTRQRAQRELRGAFIDDILARLGSPEPLYEPILGEDGRVHPRRRIGALPSDPLLVLEVLTDHLIVTAPSSRSDDSLRSLVERPFGLRVGWEKLIAEWIDEMNNRWGFKPYELVDLLRVQVLMEAEPGNRMARREAELLWKIPDVEIRQRFRRQFQSQARFDLFQKVIGQMGFYYSVLGGGASEGGRILKKSEVWELLNRFPTLVELSEYLEGRHLRSRQELPEEDGGQDEDLQKAEKPTPPAEPSSAVFAPASGNFLKGPTPSPSVLNTPPNIAQPQDREAAYQPFSEACAALLSAAHILTEKYGTDWLHWESSQADLARLRAMVLGEQGLQ